jgi:hypothetical protein
MLVCRLIQEILALICNHHEPTVHFLKIFLALLEAFSLSVYHQTFISVVILDFRSLVIA